MQFTLALTLKSGFDICSHCVAQAGLELTLESRLTFNHDSPVSTFQILELQTYATMLGQEKKLTFKWTNFKRQN